MDQYDSKLGAGVWRTEYHVRRTPSGVTRNRRLRRAENRLLLTCHSTTVIYKRELPEKLTLVPKMLILSHL